MAALNKAVLGGGNTVVSGGGVTGLETAANFCEAVNKAGAGGKVTLVCSGAELLPGYPARVQATARATLAGLGCEVKYNDRVESHGALAVAGGGAGGAFEVALRSGAAVRGVAAFVPCFSGGAQTRWLEGNAAGVRLDAAAGGRVVVDAHLRASSPEGGGGEVCQSG